MVMVGETIATGAPDVCPHCKTKLVVKVMCSNQWYIGTECQCGPYSRESMYYRTLKAAEDALKSGNFGRA